MMQKPVISTEKQTELFDIFKYRIDSLMEFKPESNRKALTALCLAAQDYIVNTKKYRGMWESKRIEDVFKKYELISSAVLDKFSVIDLVRNYYYDLSRQVINKQGKLLKDPMCSKLLTVDRPEIGKKTLKYPKNTMSVLKNMIAKDNFEESCCKNLPIVVKNDVVMTKIASVLEQSESAENINLCDGEVTDDGMQKLLNALTKTKAPVKSLKLENLRFVTDYSLRDLPDVVKAKRISECKINLVRVSPLMKTNIAKACADVRHVQIVQENSQCK